ncbi:MAG: DNA-processing protein DprA [Candidatus Margulisiibacteriota bacterium]
MLRYWVGLNMVEGLGPIKLRQRLERGDSPQSLCAEFNAPLDLADRQIETAQKNNIRIIQLVDHDYPEILKQIHDPPPILYLRGDLVKMETAVAIVGTRKATAYGSECARRLAAGLASCGLTIVSGLAMGIDTAAHEGALSAGGRTIAVLGGGVDAPTPYCNARLAIEISKSGGVISEYPLGQKPQTWSFPRRNRIVSGLCRAVIVVEGGEKSGALITARMALEQGREVMAVPGRIDSELSRGPHSLIKDGAKLVETVNDVLVELNLEPQNNERECRPAAACQLTLEEERIFARLSREPKHLDVIAAELALPGYQLSTLLLSLEIKRAVKQLPGQYYIMI